MQNEDLISLTSDIVAAHVSNNRIDVNDVAALVTSVHQALASLGQQQADQPQQEAKTPAVSIRASVKPDYLVCLECGAKQKTLKRHLQSAHNLSPQDYREQYGLKPDYPLTAPEYSARRSGMAKAAGLGRKPGQKRGGRRKK